MSNVKVLRATDPYSGGAHVFSIVASDSGAEYVFPSNKELFDGEGRLKFSLDYFGKTPTDVDKWLDVAKYNLDSFNFAPYSTNDSELTKVEDFVKNEKDALDTRENPPTPRSMESMRLEEAVNRLASSDEEIYDYLEDPSIGLSDEKNKLLIATIIAAAGTADLNPWLMPWLNGETDLDAMGFNGLILKRPISSAFGAYGESDLAKNNEGESE